MKIVVFGASGNCGTHFTRLAAAAGHDVRAVVRHKTNFFAPPNVTEMRGDVLDPGFVESCLVGQETVMSALGMRKGNRSSPEHFVFDATRNVVAAMRKHNVRRISVISAAGVGDSRAQLNWIMRLATSMGRLGRAYADLAETEQLLRDSGLEWQAVRPVTLVFRRSTGRVKVIQGYPLTATIPREDVAAFMLHELESSQFSARTPVIASVR